MTDEELITRLRDACRGLGTENLCIAAADRIEALVKERDQWIEHTKNAVWSDSEELKLANSRAERLEAALMAMRKRAMSTRGEQAYRELPVFIIRASSAALKGADHE